MAINYEQVGWDTSKYVNPTRMNHMDDGIKKACDKADEHDQQIDTLNSNLITLNNIFVNVGQVLDSTHDMNNITEGLYRQGGFNMPQNAPNDSHNAYILVVKRFRDGAGYNNDVYFQFWLSFNTNSIYFRAINPTAGMYQSWERL